MQTHTPGQRPYRLLKAVLLISGIVELVYFTASHWFFHRAFFNALGVNGPELESPFVISQLQLIGALVMGYALMNLLIAGDPERNHPLMALILAVGLGCIAIFIGNVWAGTLPALFLLNAMLLAVQIALVAMLFPWTAKGEIR